MNATALSTRKLSRHAQLILDRLQPNNVMLGPLDDEDVAAMQELLDGGWVRKVSAFVLSDWVKP